MFVQVVSDLEDLRHHYPLIHVHNISFEPILDVAKLVHDARIQLVHWNRKVNGNLLKKLVVQSNYIFDTFRIESGGEMVGFDR